MKAVAVPYVIALVLGVIAIGLLGYFFVAQGGKTTKAGFSAECQAKLFSYCIQWQTKDKQCELKNRPPADILEGCMDPPLSDKCQAINLCK